MKHLIQLRSLEIFLVAEEEMILNYFTANEKSKQKPYDLIWHLP